MNKEYGFVERGLQQHTEVTNLIRLYDRKYVVKRRRHNDVAVVLLNEYDLTADHVRTARERYGEFSDVLMTNPNGRASSAAELAAESMGAIIFKWGQFLGRLNRK